MFASCCGRRCDDCRRGGNCRGGAEPRWPINSSSVSPGRPRTHVTDDIASVLPTDRIISEIAERMRAHLPCADFRLAPITPAVTGSYIRPRCVYTTTLLFHAGNRIIESSGTTFEFDYRNARPPPTSALPALTGVICLARVTFTSRRGVYLSVNSLIEKKKTPSTASYLRSRTKCACNPQRVCSVCPRRHRATPGI